jgi:hypothetical protein
MHSKLDKEVNIAIFEFRICRDHPKLKKRLIAAYLTPCHRKFIGVLRIQPHMALS